MEGYIHFPVDDSAVINLSEIDPCPFICGFADSGWGPQDASIPTKLNMWKVTTEETHSLGGHIILTCGAPVLWKSHKEQRGSHSLCEAEIKATDECTKNIQWLPNVLDELNLLQKSKPSLIYNDNTGAIDWANTSSTKEYDMSILEIIVLEKQFMSSLMLWCYILEVKWIRQIYLLKNTSKMRFFILFKIWLFFLLTWMGGVLEPLVQGAGVESSWVTYITRVMYMNVCDIRCNADTCMFYRIKCAANIYHETKASIIS